MKQEKCRIKDACWGYCAEICEDCQTSEAIEKYVHENERLQAENAELRAKLEKAVTRSCKIGDTIYQTDTERLRLIKQELMNIENPIALALKGYTDYLEAANANLEKAIKEEMKRLQEKKE